MKESLAVDLSILCDVLPPPKCWLRVERNTVQPTWETEHSPAEGSSFGINATGGQLERAAIKLGGVGEEEGDVS